MGCGAARGFSLADDGKRLRGTRSKRDVLAESLSKYIYIYISLYIYGLRDCTGVFIGGFPKMAISLETSSKNRGVGGYRLRRLMLKMTVSLETSSKNRDVEKYQKFLLCMKNERFARDILEKMRCRQRCFTTSYVKNDVFARDVLRK